MHHITPHLWFNDNAKEAATFYASLFPQSKVNNVTTITGTPSGDTDIVNFTLFDRPFMAISAGPYFKLNPSISLFVTFEDQDEIDRVWNALAHEGEVLMEYGTYPWATKYGWVNDRFGVSWQLSLSEHHQMKSRITPQLMFVGANAGDTQKAIETYTSIFPNSSIDLIAHYEAGEGDKPELVKHARFTLNGDPFLAMGSSYEHKFKFNEAFSFIVYCETQEEIDHYWSKLSHVPEAEQCGWLKDQYGVSWQIIPTAMQEMMASKDKDKIAKVTQAFLQMKKFDIATLQAAYRS